MQIGKIKVQHVTPSEVKFITLDEVSDNLKSDIKSLLKNCEKKYGSVASYAIIKTVFELYEELK